MKSMSPLRRSLMTRSHSLTPSLSSIRHHPFLSTASTLVADVPPPLIYPSERIKAVLLENIHPMAEEILAREGYEVESHTRALSGQELIDVAGDANLLGIRSKTLLNDAFFESVGWQERRLFGIGCFCIGTNQVALNSASDSGVAVYNAPFSNTRSVAEKTIAEIIALNRKLFQRSVECHAGIWNKSATGSHEVRGTTLGIIGYGRIGSQLSVLAELLGMRVLFYDPIKCLPLGNAEQVDSLQELLSKSDSVSMHVPASEATNNMMNEETFKWMKPGAFLINNARGSTIDIKALADALDSGRVGGCAIDVFPEEPEKNGEAFDTALRGLPNVILTPHIGGSTEEAQVNIAVEVASKLVRFINDGSSTTAVNIPEVELTQLGKDRTRLLHMHHNVPGVLSKIHNVLSDFGINVTAQHLQSNNRHSYIILEVEHFHAATVSRELGKIEETIFLRCVGGEQKDAESV